MTAQVNYELDSSPALLAETVYTTDGNVYYAVPVKQQPTMM
jgi:hypothetical protein